MPGTERETRFSALVADVAPALRRYVVRRADRGSVDDVLSETMLVLWRRLDDVPSDNPLPWCYGVARNCLANAARSGRRQRRLVERLVAAPVAPEPAADPALAEALSQLTAAEQELVRLWAFEDLGPSEIAVVLGISANAVSIRLHRARSKLAELVEGARKNDAPAGHVRSEERRQ